MWARSALASYRVASPFGAREASDCIWVAQGLVNKRLFEGFAGRYRLPTLYRFIPNEI